MSVRTGNAGDGAVAGDAGGSRYVGLRDPALLGVLLLTASYVSVLYHVTDVVGGSERFALVVGGVFLLATLLGRVLRFRAAVLVTAVLVGAGFVAYYLSVPVSNRALFTTARVVEDAVALLTGLSVLRLTRAGVWALAIAPGPVFLSWYLALRERYVKSVGVGGAALFFFVLTGDAGPLVTLAGVVGSAVAVGLGTLGEVGAVAEQWDTVAVVVAAMVVLSASISVVPGGAAQPLLEDRGAPTVDGSLSGGSEGIQVLGSIRLSPAVKFTVESGEARYWGTAAYDRYTGSGWMPTGEREPYDGRLPGPPGESRMVTQRFTAKDRLNAVPSAWKPVSAEGAIGPSPDVTPQGYLRPTDGIGSNRSVTVVSEVPQYRRADLREAGDDYPRRIREAYLQLPESTSERVAERAAEVTADADNAHDAAAAIERYLERNKQYSLTVDRPEGNVADAFLFEMQSGYCTYYATTMVVMLRTQGVPARLVTGYTSGQQVGDDEYVVRGLDSHAWVQVYFPDVGWVNFDPTPAGPRQAAEDARVEEARQNGEANVDAAGSGTTTTPTTDTPEQGSDSNGTSLPNVTTAPTNGSNATVDGTPAAPSGILNAEPAAAANGTTGDGGFLPDSPSREQTGVGLALLVGSIAAGRRFGVFGRAYRTLRLYRQGARTEPTADIERAFDRLERLLARQYRERRPGETPREYLQALHNVGLDDRALEIGRLYERAHYGSAVDRTDADRAISTVDSLVWERTPVLGRLLRRS